MDDLNLRHISLEERLEIANRLRTPETPQIETRRRTLSVKGICNGVLKMIVILFALIGIGFVGVYGGVHFHLTNTEGIVDNQTEGFWEQGKAMAAVGESFPSSEESTLPQTEDGSTFFNASNYCKLKLLKDPFPDTFRRIFNVSMSDETLAQNNLDVALLSLNILNIPFTGCIETPTGSVSKKDFEYLAYGGTDTSDLFIFATSTEWAFFKASVLKDKEVLKRVENETGVKSRVIVAELVAEQMRLFYSNRAWFEKAISPLKVLASMNKYSWGVLGIKEETAVDIERNLKNPKSVFYPGAAYEQLLDFKTLDIKNERFKRITDYSNHYFDYLYAALFTKEVIAQWHTRQVDISNRPEILATLYNIGFAHSKPNPDPQTGGAELRIGGKSYSFGRIAYMFYYSGEMLEEFPQ